VDNFQKSQTNIDLPLIALGFIGLALCEGSFTFMSGRLAALTSEGTTRRLRNYLFDPIQNLSFTYHAKTETGNLVERATSNVYALRRFFSDQAIGIGRIFMLFTINFISLLNLNGTLALISIIVVPFVLTTSLFFFRRVSKAYEAYQEQAARLVGAHEFITTFSKGYDEPVGEGGNLLSVGQKQLISLAHAVLAKPEIFIMDEATSSVDTLTEALIQRGMEALIKGALALSLHTAFQPSSTPPALWLMKKAESQRWALMPTCSASTANTTSFSPAISGANLRRFTNLLSNPALLR